MSSNGATFGLNFGVLNEESQLHGTMSGTGRPLSSSGTSSASASSAAVAPSSMETTSSVTTVSTNSPSAGSSPAAKATSYESHSRLIAGYPRLPGFYGSTYSGEQSTALYPANSASFYPSLSTHYELDKSTGNSWTPLASQTPYTPYDTHHSFYSPYGNCYGAIDSAARRKNATRETTNTLKAWLYEHRKNPYPTKGEKIMLAIITKMTLTQVSTWFANARRRLKKENKMTWEPKNKSTDSRDDSDKDSCKHIDDDMSDKASDNGNGLRSGLKEDSNDGTTASNPAVSVSAVPLKGHLLSNHGLNAPPVLGPHQQVFAEGDNLDGQRPKIWSLAQTATSEASSLAGRLYPEWYAFQSNNVPDNLLLNPFPESYHHHHHAHHQTGQHVQSPANFYQKTSNQSAGAVSHWSDEQQHGQLVARNTAASNGPNGNFGCSPVPFLSEPGAVTTPSTVPHHFLLQQHRAQIPTS